MIYVYCPKGAETGGPEALHQLVDSINRQGGSACLVPIPGTENNSAVGTYERYNARWATNVVDMSSNSVVVPEIVPDLVGEFRHAKKYVWLLAAATATRDDCTYLAQSDFARVPGALMLSDYTVCEAVHGGPNYTNMVAYNGSKGAEKVVAMMGHAPNYQFVPIHGMRRLEVSQVLRRCAVYIDLGHHPGKDRLPREAAMAGCVVITNTEGSAGNSIDVPISEKVDSPLSMDVAAFLDRIMRCLDETYSRQRMYREKILREREIFDEEVRSIFL